MSSGNNRKLRKVKGGCLDLGVGGLVMGRDLRDWCGATEVVAVVVAKERERKALGQSILLDRRHYMLHIFYYYRVSLNV